MTICWLVKRLFGSVTSPHEILSLLTEQRAILHPKTQANNSFLPLGKVFRQSGMPHSNIVTQAEGNGFEPSTHCWASDFESDRWPIRIPSEMDSLKVYHTLKNPHIG